MTVYQAVFNPVTVTDEKPVRHVFTASQDAYHAQIQELKGLYAPDFVFDGKVSGFCDPSAFSRNWDQPFLSWWFAEIFHPDYSHSYDVMICNDLSALLEFSSANEEDLITEDLIEKLLKEADPKRGTDLSENHVKALEDYCGMGMSIKDAYAYGHIKVYIDAVTGYFNFKQHHNEEDLRLRPYAAEFLQNATLLVERQLQDWLATAAIWMKSQQAPAV